MRKKKWLSALAAAAMMLTLIPISAFAQEAAPENTYDSISEYTAAVSTGELDGEDVYVTIDGKNFTEQDGFVVANTQNKENPPKLHLTLTGCTFTGNTAKDNSNPSFMYLSNCKELVIDDCTFTAAEGGQKYGINWNLVGVQDAAVKITNSTFEGTYTSNAIKLTQRGGEGDSKGANETFAGVPGTISSVEITGCTFSDSAKVAFGTQAKEVAFEGGTADVNVANLSTGSFPVTMSGNTAVTVSEQYLANQAGEPVETAIPAGTAVNKAADAAIAGSEAFPFTDINAYTAAVKMHGLDGKDVYVDIKGQEFSAENGTYFEVANTQSYANPPKLHLTLTDCTFIGNTANDTSNPSFMYLPNCQSLDIDGCTFTAVNNQKYGINWNLVGIQGATVSVKNSTFTGPFEKNALKLNQRNGEDDKATDVKGGNTTPASIASAVIEGCTFNDAVVSLGSQGKNENGTASPSTGAFPITIQNNKTDVEVEQAYMAAESEEIPSVTLEAGELLVKDADDTEVHTPVKVEAKAPTATEPGNIEYWYCTTCGKCYTDAALTQEIPESETIIAATGEEPSDPSTEDPTTDPEETPSTKPEENPDDTANSNPDSSSSTTPPQTGDNSNMAIWFVLLLASAGLAGTTFVVKKRSVR